MSSHKKKNVKLLAYIIVPVIFTIIGYLLIWAAVKPVWDMGSAMLSMVMADKPPVFDTELTSIYDPNAAKPEVVDTKKNYISGADIDYPSYEAQYGELICDRLEIDAPVYWGDTNAVLRNGVGHYIGSQLPGYGGIILLCAHNTTYFRPFEYAEVGDVFQFKTYYADYEYEVKRIEVLDENDLDQYYYDKQLDYSGDELVMYTCYPFYAISGRKTDRITLFCERISGPDVYWRPEQYEQ